MPSRPSATQERRLQQGSSKFLSVPLAIEGRLTGVRWNLDIGSYSNAMALGVATGLRYRIGSIASLFLLVEENVSSFHGSRLRAMLLFQVDTWL